MITFLDEPYYIGEAKNIDKRVRQQSNENSSTFYKNYIIEQKKINEKIDINEFEIQRAHGIGYKIIVNIC